MKEHAYKCVIFKAFISILSSHPPNLLSPRFYVCFICSDCSACSKGYTRSSGFACKSCPDHANEGIALAAFGFLLAFIALLSYMLSGKRRETDRGIVAHVTWFIPLHSVKIVIVVWQILTQVRTTTILFRHGRPQQCCQTNLLSF